MSAEELAKLAQNPVGNLISVPFQNNTNFNFGPLKGTQNILNIQPVVPIQIEKDWNIITRTILPLISQPALSEGDSRTNGVGDLQFTAFLSPANPGEWIWGAGPILQAPTHNKDLGNDHWGLGPSFVVLHLDKGSPWVYGVLMNNLWSVGSGNASPSYNNGLVQPFINYNLPDGAYLTSAPDHHDRLESLGQPAGDAAARWRRRQDLPLRQAAGEHADLGLLQRRSPGQCGELAAPRASPADVPEVAFGPRRSRAAIHQARS